MTLEQKIGQFFFPAVFINDTEEKIQETERLIKKHNIGGLTFFHSRASAATKYEIKKKVTLLFVIASLKISSLVPALFYTLR